PGLLLVDRRTDSSREVTSSVNRRRRVRSRRADARLKPSRYIESARGRRADLAEGGVTLLDSRCHGPHLSRAETEDDPGTSRDCQERGTARRGAGILADEQGPSAAGALQGARNPRSRARRGRRHRQTGPQGEDARAEEATRRCARGKRSLNAEERAAS